MSVPPSENPSELKIVVVGDGAVGKTCFCTVYAKKEFPGEYVPTVFETHPMQMTLYGKEYTVTVWDTAGQEEFDHIRRLSYGGADAFLVCYSTIDKVSLKNIKEKWIKELDVEAPTASKILVGTMADRKNTEGDREIPSKSDVQKIVRDLNFMTSMECSAKTDPDSVEEVFRKCFENLLNPPSPDNIDCNPFKFFKQLKI